MKKLGGLLSNRNTKAGVTYLFGNILVKAIAFLTVPIFTRIMTTAEYGVVNTYMSWVSILSLLIGLSLGNSIRSAYIDYNEKLDEYISSLLFLSFINMMGFTLITFLVFKSNLIAIDPLLLVLCLIQSYSTFVLATVEVKYMVSFEYKKKTILSTLPNIIAPILAILLLFTMDFDKTILRIVPHVVVLAIIATAYFAFFLFKGKKVISLEYWKYALKFSLPLVFHGLSMTILASSDRTMLTALRSSSETGIYSIVYNLSMIATVITSSMESVWIPWFNEKMKKDEKDSINKKVVSYIEIALIIMILILMVGPEFLKILAPKEYWDGIKIIPPILLSSFLIFLYSISVNLEYYYKSTPIIAINTLMAAVINVVLNFIFIPKHGMYAAAYTTVVAYLIMFIVHYISARKLDKSLFPFSIYVTPMILMIVAATFSYLTRDYYIVRWGGSFVGFSVYVILSYKNGRFNNILNKGDK